MDNLGYKPDIRLISDSDQISDEYEYISDIKNIIYITKKNFILFFNKIINYKNKY
jgi:hypothetical protein